MLCSSTGLRARGYPELEKEGITKKQGLYLVAKKCVQVSRKFIPEAAAATVLNNYIGICRRIRIRNSSNNVVVKSLMIRCKPMIRIQNQRHVCLRALMKANSTDIVTGIVTLLNNLAGRLVRSYDSHVSTPSDFERLPRPLIIQGGRCSFYRSTWPLFR